MAVFLGVLVAALDLLRAYVGPSLRPYQWLAGLAAVAWLWRCLSRRGAGRAVLPIVALAACLLPVSVDHARSIEADGVHYYSYLRSLLFDGDLELRNDYRLLEFDEEHKNVVPVGASLLWSPFVVVVYLFAQAARLFGAAAPTGVEPVFQAVVAQATFVYSAAGLYLLMDALRRLAWPPSTAFWVTLVLWVGSPLRFYLSVLPAMGHGTEFFAAALVLHSALRLREAPAKPARALLAGAACGLLFLVRSQDGLLLALPVAMLLPRLLSAATRRDASKMALRVGVAFCVVALPQLAVWQAMYDTPVLNPYKVIHGEEFMHLDRPELVGMLISPRGGLFTSYPMLLVAFLGLLALLRREPLFVLSALPILLGGWYVNATVFDWYQVRRFTGIVPLLAPGLACALAPLARAGALPLALVAFSAWRYDLAVDALRDQPGQPAPVRAVLERAADGVAGDSYALLEPRLPEAAVGLLAAYTGDGLLRDRDPVSRIDLGRETSLLRLPRPARNLSPLSAEDGLACRWVQGDIQATFFLPLAWDGDVTVTLTVHPLETAAPMNMEVLLNEHKLGSSALIAGWSDYRFAAPAGTARLGTNALVVRFDRAPVYHQVRGRGPRQRRPAAIAVITLHRGEPRS